MAEYDDGAYYELQLNNKQLVFFFMAALSIAVVVFLCGVMVGRGVHDATLLASQNDIASGTLRADAQGSSASPAASGDSAVRGILDYTDRLEGDGRADSVTAPAISSDSPETTVASSARAPMTTHKNDASSAPRNTPRSEASRTTTTQGETKPRATSPAAAKPTSAASIFGGPSGAFTIQVVALKTADAARSLMGRLQSKNYRAYLEEGGESGLHRVRVGRFATRTEAEQVARKLQQEWKFRPYITQ
jgi:cell division septation protein DedD